MTIAGPLAGRLTLAGRMHARAPSLRQRLGPALFVGGHSAVSLGIVGAVAYLTGSPWVFPSLGPSLFLFYTAPRSPAASPRNTLLGHAIGLLAGWIALQATGAGAASGPLAAGVDPAHLAASALAIGLTSAGMLLFDAPHPPGGATTLIVALGLLSRPADFGVMAAAILAITAHATVVLRLARAGYPRWRAPDEPAEGRAPARAEHPTRADGAA